MQCRPLAKISNRLRGVLCGDGVKDVLEGCRSKHVAVVTELLLFPAAFLCKQVNSPLVCRKVFPFEIGDLRSELLDAVVALSFWLRRGYARLFAVDLRVAFFFLFCLPRRFSAFRVWFARSRVVVDDLDGVLGGLCCLVHVVVRCLLFLGELLAGLLLQSLHWKFSRYVARSWGTVP